MARELAYVIVTPHTISKSRTGGALSRYLSRTDLALVAARMFNPSNELVERYASTILDDEKVEKTRTRDLLVRYVRREFGPNPQTLRPRRVLFLLFEGEDAVRKIWEITGGATEAQDTGETVRQTYGDFIQGAEEGDVRYFEPAVLVAPHPEHVSRVVRLWAEFSDECGGLVQSSHDYDEEGQPEKTLVMLKPDNFRVPSRRAGSIMDVLSTSGLRVVCAKKFRMTVAQAERFYGPVQQVLEGKFPEIGGQAAVNALSKAFGFTIPHDVTEPICEALAPHFARAQFERIVCFMTGFLPTDVEENEKAMTGSEECLALVYEGPEAVDKIRSILGATDPSKAAPGSVRREFGSDVMVNAAHASDSVDNAIREMDIIHVTEDSLQTWVAQYCQ
jgi:nucleoside diphosphate kinase